MKLKNLHKSILALTLLLAPSVISAQNEGFKYDLYGFFRTDFYYNSRANVSACNEVFYLYPLDESLDANGEDLNEIPSSGFFSFATRLGVDVTAPKVGNMDVTGKIEVDFGGFGAYSTLLRIRQANINLNWEKRHNLLLGQTWHPLFGSVMPYITNLSTGAPFQPFNRSPQIRYDYSAGKWKLTAAAIWQLQYTSTGPDGSSIKYLQNSCTPELYAGFDYINGGFQFGGGLDYISIKPRTSAEYSGATYKVDEVMNALSGEVHMRYHNEKFNIAAKSILASALNHTLLLGGYGVTSDSANSLEREYTPLQNSTTWVNVTYGKVWRPSIYIGYTKNLGSSEELASTNMIYGSGVNIDQLLGTSIGISYNKNNFTLGLEYSITTASYGDIDLTDGTVNNTHDVSNHRIAAIGVLYF